MSDHCKACGFPLVAGTCDNLCCLTHERCNKCRGILDPREDQHALEVGSGYCDACGHEELAGELARLGRDAAAIAALAGFNTLAAARAHVSRTR